MTGRGGSTANTKRRLIRVQPGASGDRCPESADPASNLEVLVDAEAMLIMSIHYIHKWVWIPIVVYSILTAFITQSWLDGLAKARKAQDVAYLNLEEPDDE